MKAVHLLVLALVLLQACTKSDGVVAPAIPPRTDETPLATLLKNSPGDYVLQTHAPQAKELGYLFVPLKKGRIYALGIRMPQVGESFKVTLWDTLTRQVVKQKTILNQSTTGFTYIDLSASGNNEEVDVEKNRAYIISVNTAPLSAGTPNRQWYLMSRARSEDFLPLTRNNIQILAGRYSSMDAPGPTYPDKDHLSVFGLHLVFGLVDIGYYATAY